MDFTINFFFFHLSQLSEHCNDSRNDSFSNLKSQFSNQKTEKNSRVLLKTKILFRTLVDYLVESSIELRCSSCRTLRDLVEIVKYQFSFQNKKV